LKRREGSIEECQLLWWKRRVWGKGSRAQRDEQPNWPVGWLNYGFLLTSVERSSHQQIQHHRHTHTHTHSHQKPHHITPPSCGNFYYVALSLSTIHILFSLSLFSSPIGSHIYRQIYIFLSL
jgi:hypothetical protein